ncbi:2'-5' RNA ligase superfamily protein [Arthrobacter sp. SLBN-100]|uniref:2'-5' RNA ligase family protein n=1 Tax=Arthrobacter sp. SLBN-100 TaxID=2768450 RepID=UPI00114FB377|nr:2'-5' RNA ligase family protein [Arthrobacter sp. SLBN-100]TQJ68963.1 2'-5' RNA ligase superfamily protein [Arthrobacter sp. SLBN-100]
MRNLILVAFVEPVTDGLVFPRTQWPLHITLLRFDVDSDGVVEQVAALAAPHAEAALGAALTVGKDAGFGRNGSVPVNLIQPQPDLQTLHGQLVATVGRLGGKILTPAHTLSGYRPHVSHHGGKRLNPGDAVVLDRIALVDMAPDGDRTVRRILRLWSRDHRAGNDP